MLSAILQSLTGDYVSTLKKNFFLSVKTKQDDNTYLYIVHR